MHENRNFDEIRSSFPIPVFDENPKFNALYYKACDWSKKYALSGEEGHKYTGSNSNFELPEEITEENLADAMKKADRILSYRPTTVHRCIIECPLVQR